MRHSICMRPHARRTRPLGITTRVNVRGINRYPEPFGYWPTRAHEPFLIPRVGSIYLGFYHLSIERLTNLRFRHWWHAYMTRQRHGRSIQTSLARSGVCSPDSSSEHVYCWATQNRVHEANSMQPLASSGLGFRRVCNKRGSRFGRLPSGSFK